MSAQSQADARARLTVRASATFAVGLRRVLTAIERAIRPLVDAVTVTTSSVERGAQVTEVRRAIRRAVSSSGFAELARSAYRSSLDQMAVEVLGGATVTVGIARRLEALRLVARETLIVEEERLAAALWQAVMRGAFSDRPVALILSDLEALLDRSESQIRTLYDTSVSVYGRQVEALVATDDPETPFLYVGPDDEVTRPFCQAHVGNRYTRVEINALANGQLPNVFLTGGGYNCRHSWIEVSRVGSVAVEAAA